MKFSGGLHLSRGKADNYDLTQVTLHSDTLKSALCVAALQLYGNAIDGSFFDDFRISSAFPFLEKDGQNWYFLPRPKRALNLTVPGIPGKLEAKLLKKIEYVEYRLLAKLLAAGEAKLPIQYTNLSKDKNLLCDDLDLSEEKVFDSAAQQHVHVSRDLNKDNSPYVIDKLHFQENAGLYFLLQDRGDNLDRIKNALEVLRDSGSGTDKNTGGGFFTYEWEDNGFKWPEQTAAKHQLNLSLYCPLQDEVKDLSDAAYQLTRRGGYITHPENNAHLTARKRSVYMFSEGSVFPYLDDRRGQLKDLRPKNAVLTSVDVPIVTHPIWRDGQALFLPF
ncbi:MAG: type III-A CRISPR-associated RAMP protein Csm4 [Phaeodactylibacter sp.]|nr:type III-A CRISPR-associated RAMP protein Csm4 [Phaeodactylibacter sp.]